MTAQGLFAKALPETPIGLPNATLAQADEDDDSTLIARANRGDGEAFGSLVGRHYDFVFRTAYKWCGHRSDAEDVAQDVCIKLAVALRSFDGRSAFSTWLYRITLNAVRDGQRARSRQSRQGAALAQLASEDDPGSQEDAVAMREIWAAVRQLPDQQRDAVLLVYAEELSHAEAAAIMGCKESTVSFHVHAARKTLRGLL